MSKPELEVRRHVPKPQWFHVTRAVGIFTALYGLLVDDSPERGTIILAGFGLAGFDFAARKDTKTSNG